ncbi:hypothetical protein CK215_28725 [Mesorhizobium sp. WSM3864]|uniref:zinc-binding dehydrogenase n=1 Tax=Mesorhizobium sp. WSM3864 TaxID=2029404 RepID=UPI000BAF7A56|nr:zinc-binding dehydrogenase [Mesorhizobium sp. WSM3864]PBB89240.1 hypothetical protein CK215_28725 [Mesorhizobium sp. WSM3864]
MVITGASGGIGSAAVQLARRRGAYVHAIAGRDKAEFVREAGADQVLPRDENLVDHLGNEKIDVAIDVLQALAFRNCCKYSRKADDMQSRVRSAGPLVELDVRTLYLKGLTFFGCTFQEDVAFDNLVEYAAWRKAPRERNQDPGAEASIRRALSTNIPPYDVRRRAFSCPLDLPRRWMRSQAW